jgi:hypothetical protein
MYRMLNSLWRVCLALPECAAELGVCRLLVKHYDHRWDPDPGGYLSCGVRLGLSEGVRKHRVCEGQASVTAVSHPGRLIYSIVPLMLQHKL